MPAAPLPLNEPARLEALRRLHVLDTPADPRLDWLVQLAARRLRVNFAALVFIDAERQWFKATVGLPVRETPRSASLCSHVVHRECTVVVADASRDPMLCDNPFVVGPPGVRFYAGAPLRAASGHIVGTLCIGGAEPRVLTRAEVAEFESVADLVNRELMARAFVR